MTRDDIISAARAEIGTPFRHQGRISGKALDCAGLIILVAKAIGAEYLDFTGYSRHPSDGLLESALDAQPCLVRVALADMQAGDILLMRFNSDPQHLAIFTGTTLIHAYAVAATVCEHDFTPKWAARVVAIYRFVGVTHV